MVDWDRKEVVAVRKIYDNRVLAAVLCLTLDYDKIFQPFSGMVEDETGAAVTDSKDRVVYANIAYMKDFRGKGLSDGSLHEMESDGVLKEIREEYFSAKSTSGENGWNFYLFRSKDAIAGEVKQLFLEEIPLIFLCTLIVFALGTVFSRLFTRKIEELTRNMDQVNHGSREVTVFSDSEDEVGILVRSFRRMMDEDRTV